MLSHNATMTSPLHKLSLSINRLRRKLSRKQDCWHIESTGIQTYKNWRMAAGVAEEEGAGRAEEVQNKVTECG
jgi:hypothetical protein